MFSTLLKRDLRSAWLSGGGAANGVAFFGMSYALTVMAFSPEQVDMLRQPLLAICLLLTVMLSLPALLDEDVRDGTMEQYFLLPLSQSWLMSIKMFAYWLGHVVPVLLLALLIQLAEQGDADILRLTLMSLWLTALGSISAVIAFLQAKGTVARALIIIPLYLPALIAATLMDHSNAMLMLQAAIALVLWPLAAFIGGYLLHLLVE